MSNSIGNLKNSGLQGNNFPWQLKMLQGQQCACDYLKEIDLNTDQVEPLLIQILAAIQSGTDYEAALVVDANDVTWLEVRIWNGTTFDAPIYFLAGQNTSGIPVAPISYINPNTYLAQIVSYTSNLVSIEAGTPDALGQTTMSASMPVALANDQANVMVVPVVLESINALGDLLTYAGSTLFSISFSNRGTAAGIVSVDGGNNYVKIYPGETLNLDANGVMNYYDPTLFYWDTTNPGASLLIAFNYL